MLRDYGRIPVGFWGLDALPLRGDAPGLVVLAYLYTSPLASMAGIYAVEPAVIGAHTGLTEAAASAALMRVCAAGLASYDAAKRVVFVRGMAAAYYGEALARRDKRTAGIVRDLRACRGHRFVGELSHPVWGRFCN